MQFLDNRVRDSSLMRKVHASTGCDACSVCAR